MEDDVKKLKSETLKNLEKITTTSELQNLKTQLLGKKGRLSRILKQLARLPIDERRKIGQIVNSVKQEIIDNIEKKESEISVEKNAWLDITAPGHKPTIGSLHPITLAIAEIASIFEKIGFSRLKFTEIDWDWYVFEGLNMPKDHPARDEWETFFVDFPPHKKLGELVLTTHTTNFQLHVMEKLKPPIGVINIGRCYRRQSDVSHTPVFHQFDGFAVDKNLSICNLKAVLDYFVKSFFGPKRQIRIRPFHFRFTEPSFEVDVTCGVCQGKGCRLCKQGWLELGGAGMVHPQVLANGGIDPKIYTGFAWGWGVERVLMMKEDISLPDIRILYENDIRFLQQF